MEEGSITCPLIKGDHQADTGISTKQECAKGGWRSCGYLIGVEVAERFAIFGVSGNLITYLTNVLHESTATAAKNVNIWTSSTTLLPIVGAFIADTYLGQFKMILIASIIYVVGLLMLMISVSVVPLEFQHVTFFLSLYLVAIGEGGHKPCVQTFGANQFDDNSPEEKKAKSSFFNWWYFGICTAAGAANLIVIYVQDNVGWFVGFGIPAVAMSCSLVIFLLGQRSYKQHTPQGSPFARVLQVFFAAFHKRNVHASKGGNAECSDSGVVDVAMDIKPKALTLSRTNEFKCLDKATIVDEIDASSMTINNWSLCTMHQVEEAKLLLRLVPVWLNCLVYSVVYAQGSTFMTKQGSTMDTLIGHNFHVPPASLQVFIGIAVLVFVPIYEQVFVPIARRFTGHRSGITMLQRIGFGMFLTTIEMVVAALVETKRLRIASEHGLIDEPNKTVPMSIWWLVPQYLIIGVSDVFTVVGLQELFYDQMPADMKSMGSAAYLSVMGIGNLLSSSLISIVQYVSARGGDEWLVNNLNLAHLDYYYWLLALLSIFGLGSYIGVTKNFVYKRTGSDILS